MDWSLIVLPTKKDHPSVVRIHPRQLQLTAASFARFFFFSVMADVMGNFSSDSPETVSRLRNASSEEVILGKKKEPIQVTSGSHPIDKTYLVGGIPTPLKNMSSPVGMMKFPIYGKIKVISKPPTRYNFFLAAMLSGTPTLESSSVARPWQPWTLPLPG